MLREAMTLCKCCRFVYVTQGPTNGTGPWLRRQVHFQLVGMDHQVSWWTQRRQTQRGRRRGLEKIHGLFDLGNVGSWVSCSLLCCSLDLSGFYMSGLASLLAHSWKGLWGLRKAIDKRQKLAWEGLPFNTVTTSRLLFIVLICPSQKGRAQDVSPTTQGTNKRNYLLTAQNT